MQTHNYFNLKIKNTMEKLKEISDLFPKGAIIFCDGETVLEIKNKLEDNTSCSSWGNFGNGEPLNIDFIGLRSNGQDYYVFDEKDFDKVAEKMIITTNS